MELLISRFMILERGNYNIEDCGMVIVERGVGPFPSPVECLFGGEIENAVRCLRHWGGVTMRTAVQIVASTDCNVESIADFQFCRPFVVTLTRLECKI